MPNEARGGGGLVPSQHRPSLPGGPDIVPQVLDAGVAAHPDRVALVGRSGRYTYAELSAAVPRAAGALRSLGIAPGDRVAASLPNDVDIVLAFLASQYIGAIWLGISPVLAPPEKAYIIEDAGVSLLLDDPQTWRRALEGAEPIDRVAVDPFAPAAIAYTSGTTGYPKGVVHSQHNLLLPGYVLARTGGLGSVEVQGVALPLTILNLIVLGPLVAFQVGTTTVCMDRVDPVGMAEWIRTERIATFSAVPAMIHDLLHHPDVHDDDLVTLTRPGVGGAGCPEAFRELYRKRFGTEVTSGYGLTEAPTVVTMEDREGPLLPGSAGRPLPQFEVLILDERGEPVPDGDAGEICFRAASEGPFAGLYTPMLGYWNRPESTAAALEGGVVHTGDVGRIGEGGNLFVEDRKADLIIRGGANVYPAEVERVLHGDQRVTACAVVGAPDERLGERVMAFVQLAPGANVEEGDLLERCRAELARYKVPDQIVFVEQFERTPMGKIRKTPLREQLSKGAS